MKLRIMQIILFFPCCLIDGISLIIIHMPMWIVIGTKATNREPLLQWLFEKTNQ
jgi:hypothetical protein